MGLPKASCTSTTTAGESPTPAAAEEGCTVKANLVATPVETSKETLAAPARPATVATRV